MLAKKMNHRVIKVPLQSFPLSPSSMSVCNNINPLNPIVHFWLHHTAHCAEKIVSARLRAGSASAERVGQGEVGGTGGGGWDRGRWVGSPVGCCAHGGC